MNTYVILRRSGWSSPTELQQAAARSEAAGENMADEVRWIRSYVMSENSGKTRDRLYLPSQQPRGYPSTRRHCLAASR